MNKLLKKIDIERLKSHFDHRLNAHKKISTYLEDSDPTDYLELALGISNPYGNYSAYEYNLGRVALSNNKHSSIVKFAKNSLFLNSQSALIDLIYETNLHSIKISVGTEMAMMLKPDVFWVINIRTIWTNYLVKHNFDIDLATEVLNLYHDAERPSDIDYQLWKYESASMKININKLLSEAADITALYANEVTPYKFIWFDCIANALYENL